MGIITHLPIIFTLLSGLAFIWYGSSCLFTGAMAKEFKRYDLDAFRKIVGYLELLGGIGSLIGLTYNPLLILSSAGLTLLMLLGVIVRIKSKDALVLTLPALTLMLINAYILLIAIENHQSLTNL
jgi:hypothetical protein